MLLTITSTASPATDLGFLLHKHPDRVQQVEVAGGVGHVLYPEATPERCTVALVLELDPVELARRRRLGPVNDRAYAATSVLSVALGRAFRTAMAGRCDARPELVERPLPLEVRVPAAAAHGGGEVVRRLFEPLGWQVEASPLPLDGTIPAWGEAPYVDLVLRGEVVLAQALRHLAVLLPVLDDAQHHWIGRDEVETLLGRGEGWLDQHPERDLVLRRYLRHQRDLVQTATARLAGLDDTPADRLEDADAQQETTDLPLAVLRRRRVLDVLRSVRAARVVDLGCGEGALLRELVRDPAFTEVVGLDVSARALEVAEKRLGLDRLPDAQRDTLRLAQSSVVYRDDRFTGYDAVVLMEVVEHVDPDRLPALESHVFATMRPTTVVLTTPNAEHNPRFPGLAHGAMRHPDHRFEWTRAELAAWSSAVCEAHGYAVQHLPVGDDDPEVGPPTQLAVFTRVAA